MNLDRELRPKSFDEYIASNNEGIVKDFKAFLRTNDMPHVMLVGPPGCGKNTLFWIFASLYHEREISIDTGEYDPDYKVINAGKDRGIDTVRDDIADYVAAPSRAYPKKKVVLLDEFDNPTHDMQMALKSIMETYEDNCIFGLLMNDDSKIIDAIISRCYVAHFKRPDFVDIGVWFKEKAELKGVTFESPELIEDIVEHYEGDFRRMLVDCLEPLRGYTETAPNGETINKVITKDDLWKIYATDTRKFALEVFENENKKHKFFELWKKYNFDERKFLLDYFKVSGMKMSAFFSKIDSRLRRGCNPMIQISALFDALER